MAWFLYYNTNFCPNQNREDLMKGYIFWLMLPVLLFLYPLQSHAFLKKQGKYIVDSSGQKVLLKGIGLGGWLVPEGYQLHIPGFGSPTSIKNKIIDLIGEENTQQFYEIYHQNYVNEQDIQQIASWGFNSLRLPFNYKMLSPEDQPGVYLEEGFRIIDRLLEWCEQNRLYLILDMHCAPGGQNKANISDSDGIEARLWTETENQDRTVALWKEIARRYADEEWIGGYDLLNEPVLPEGFDSHVLRALYMRITQAIREVDTNHIIFIEGNWWATDFTALTPPWDNNMVYSFHKYWNEISEASIRQYLDIRKIYSFPLWLGESGENSNPWFNHCVQLMEQNEIGWCWWTHKKIATTTSPYSSPITENYQRILDYWNGDASRPSVDFAKAALLEMADMLKLENCQFRPDVLHSLFDKNFSTESKPYKENHIPGTIFCVDYDMGDNEVSYKDNDFQQIHGYQSGEDWNKGWEYRNDGVDIEVSHDENGAPYDIGWINDNEWLQYSVTIDHTGEYEISLRIASPNNGGKLQLTLDDLPLTGEIEVPSSGGWSNWMTIKTSPVELTIGNHKLTLRFLVGGFNINYIKFDACSAVKQDKAKRPVNYDLQVKSYPNPFNNSVTISYHLTYESHIVLKIFNIAGELISTLIDSEQSAGNYTIKWNYPDAQSGEKFNVSGIYFYRLQAEIKNDTIEVVNKIICLK